MSDIAGLIGSALNEVTAKQEAWLQDACQQLGLTPEEIAEQYELEVYPMETVPGDGDTVLLVQNVRLKRRVPPTPESENSTITEFDLGAVRDLAAQSEFFRTHDPSQAARPDEEEDLDE